MRLVAELPHRDGSLLRFAALHSPAVAVTATDDRAYVWAVDGAGSHVLRTMAPAAHPRLRSGSGAAHVRCAAMWDDSLALGCEDGRVRVYDVLSGALLSIFPLHPYACTAVSLVDAGAAGAPRLLLLTAGADAALLVDPGSGVVVARAPLPAGNQHGPRPSTLVLGAANLWAGTHVWARGPIPSAGSVASKVGPTCPACPPSSWFGVCDVRAANV